MSTPCTKRLWMVAAFAAVSLTGITGVVHSDANPQVTIPSLPLPKPNAFDYDIAAGKALRDSLKISEASSEVAKAGGIPSSLAADRALIQENEAALRQVRAGFAFRYVSPQPRVENPVYPYLPRLRSIVQLLALDARVRAADQDWGGATNSALDAIQLGEDMPHGSAEIGWLAGLACQVIGRKALWAFVPQLTAAQAHAATHRLEEIQAEHTPYGDVMQEEEWTEQASLLATFHQRDWREAMIKDTFDDSGITDDDSGRSARIVFRTELQTMSKQAIFDDRTHYMDAVVYSARGPYAAKIPVPHLPLDPQQALGYSLFHLDPYQSQQIRDTDSETQNALLTVELALQAYSSEHGSLPESLDALVSSYLNHVPSDFFALSGPLRYRIESGHYILYSVGPDGKDDHGTAIADASQPAPVSPGASDRRHFVLDNSRGDVVAGINP